MKKIFTLLIISMCVVGYIHAVNMHIEQLNSSDYILAIQQIGKLVIDGTDLKFYDRQGKLLYTTNIATTSAITFSEDASALENNFAANREHITVYPNPATTQLIVSGADEQSSINIYSTDGKLITTAIGSNINVENLTPGTYLLQCQNQIIRIIKQ